MLGCGGGADADADATAVADETSLREAQQKYVNAFLVSDAAKFYSYLSLDAQKSCSPTEIAALIAVVHGYVGDALSGAELEVDQVIVEGNDGWVLGDLYADGQQLGFGTMGKERINSWAFTDGKWLKNMDCNDFRTRILNPPRAATPAP